MSTQDFAKATDPRLRAFAAQIRRYAIKLTAKTLWQLVGVKNLDGTDETVPAEAFPGIGLYARPPTTGKPEAIAVMVGGANSPAIVGTRDEKTRAAMAGSIQVDETMIFNSRTMVYVLADGTVEVRNKIGVAVPLATMADVAALASFVQGLTVGGTGSAPIPPGTVPQPIGTTVLKGQ